MHIWLGKICNVKFSNNWKSLPFKKSMEPLATFLKYIHQRECKHNNRVVTRYMRSGITAPGSGITTLGIGISSVLVESGIKIVNVFGIRDQNSQCFCDQGLKFSTFLWSGIKIWGKNTGSVMKKYTLLRLCNNTFTLQSFDLYTNLRIYFKMKTSTEPKWRARRNSILLHKNWQGYSSRHVFRLHFVAKVTLNAVLKWK